MQNSPNIEFTRIRYPRAKPRGTRVANSRSLTLSFHNQRTPTSLSVTIPAHPTHLHPRLFSKIPFTIHRRCAQCPPKRDGSPVVCLTCSISNVGGGVIAAPSPRRACARRRLEPAHPASSGPLASFLLEGHCRHRDAGCRDAAALVRNASQIALNKIKINKNKPGIRRAKSKETHEAVFGKIKKKKKRG